MPSTEPDVDFASTPAPASNRDSVMLAVQDVALPMFERHGYSAVSVEDVAAAALISPRSIYRYFGSKEQLVVWDPIDGRVVEYLASLTAEHESVDQLFDTLVEGYTELIRRAMSPEDEARLQVRMRLINAVPRLRAGELKQTELMAQSLLTMMSKSVLAQQHSEVNLRVAAYQIAWSLLAIADEWAERGFAEAFHDVLDRTVPILLFPIKATLQPPT